MRNRNRFIIHHRTRILYSKKELTSFLICFSRSGINKAYDDSYVSILVIRLVELKIQIKGKKKVV